MLLQSVITTKNSKTDTISKTNYKKRYYISCYFFMFKFKWWETKKKVCNYFFSFQVRQITPSITIVISCWKLRLCISLAFNALMHLFFFRLMFATVFFQKLLIRLNVHNHICSQQSKNECSIQFSVLQIK